MIPRSVLFGNPDRLSPLLSPDGERIVTASKDNTAYLWDRRRPEWWWGVAWLSEFWLTVVLAGALGWSLWNDRKRLKRVAA